MSKKDEDLMDHLNNQEFESNFLKNLNDGLSEVFKEDKDNLSLLEDDDEEWDEEDYLNMFGPNSLGQHEILDRLNIIVSNLNDFVCVHPSVVLNEKVYRLIRIGQRFLIEAHSLFNNVDEVEEDEED